MPKDGSTTKSFRFRKKKMKEQSENLHGKLAKEANIRGINGGITTFCFFEKNRKC